MKKRVAVSALVVALAIAMLFSGCSMFAKRPDPAQGLEVVMSALMTRDKSELEAFYPGVDLSDLNLDEIYGEEIDELVNDPSLGFTLTEEQSTRMKELLYTVFERVEYSAETKAQDNKQATVLLKLKSVDLAGVFGEVPEDAVTEVTKRALEQGVSLTDESALTALAVDMMLEHWETAVSEAELTGEAEAEIQMQWTDGFWMPDEDALVAVVTEAFGN